ncbi:LytTR family DNA-binding domain-containing protein [Polaribacter sp. PL03]|uniref:LytR/AlgR family response regulator transcription factor n=1 Tax=Polaribacter sp. PL03 TaxID=3088353 RepID=UPI0029CD8CA7|nr:LytTR family DNA-binding domain-containing protein [Polaribacter sp. PL03]MDX6746186.1 LytTR family DNA-binding domain-containing protein [Polaribacter sp. PL03]
MKAIIIEDELPSARRLERLLQDFEIEILEKLNSVKASVLWFQKNKQPDLIFLDVQLSDGLCFEIFNQVKITSKIIFTTAFSNYSIKAFDYNSVSYLLKPINKEKLKEAILKAKKVQQKEIDFEQFRKLVSNYKSYNYKKSFTIRVGKKIKIINSDNIACFYSFENATFLNTSNGNYIINNSLTSLESDLDSKKFFRVNRTFIVRKDFIKEIIAHSNSRLKLILISYSETEIIVSRERVKDFKSWIN